MAGPLDKYRAAPLAPSAPSSEGGSALAKYKTQPAPSSTTSEESSLLPLLLGAGGLTAAALLARKPGMLGSAFEKANTIRQQLMLSGLAVPKSLLGGAGAAVENAIETGSMRPVREMLNPQTLRDFKTAFKTGGYIGPTPGMGEQAANLPKWMNLPGRILGAGDTAARQAMERAGMTATESQAALLQKPLPKGFEVMESKAARYAFPFRRTPFNQFLSGLEKIKQAEAGDVAARRGLAAYGTAGAAHGALTADEQYPVTVPLGIAASARYGLPYVAGAMIGRIAAGGKGSGGMESSALPVSEYGFKQAFEEPLRPYREPALLKLLKGKKK